MLRNYSTTTLYSSRNEAVRHQTIKRGVKPQNPRNDYCTNWLRALLQLWTKLQIIGQTRRIPASPPSLTVAEASKLGTLLPEDLVNRLHLIGRTCVFFDSNDPMTSWKCWHWGEVDAQGILARFWSKYAFALSINYEKIWKKCPTTYTGFVLIEWFLCNIVKVA